MKKLIIVIFLIVANVVVAQNIVLDDNNQELFNCGSTGSLLSCTEFDEIIIYSLNVEGGLLLDTFAPNGNNLNQRFFPVNLDINSNLAALRVFNCWGELESGYRDCDLGWDGTFEGKDQAADVYSYYIRIEKPFEDFI
ncbi:MAG: gliding motility-associated C-terminal domain-containing protein [Flavobacteriales bacterium]|nr:gliding motility-associated C-terminal domain-containing protein [Flavobacteriales bacterium]MCB9256135.1 gliding motility-associated C-terminal domain-containing protein [Chitinophagales bacterium]